MLVRVILGFPHRASVGAGDVLRLHVATDAPRFRIEVSVWGGPPRWRSAWLRGEPRPLHLPWQDWSRDNRGLRGEHLAGWSGYDVPIPPGWTSGVYVAALVEGEADGSIRDPEASAAPDRREGRALFALLPRRGAPRSPILYKLPLLTWHAYDQVSPQRYDPSTGTGLWCLYTIPEADQLPVAVPPSVNLRRPGGGTGGTPFDLFNVDPFDPTPRQTFVHWDAPFLSWLAAEGRAVDVCTDLDLHEAGGPELLAQYPLLVSAGHDEYWTGAMRDHVEGYVARGGNVAFFGGNTCWGRIIFEEDGTTFSRVGNWRDRPEPDRPENALTGVSFRNGGERDGHEHPAPVGYRVQHHDHWVFEGTGLDEGEVFGDGPDEYLVGYECDGAEFDRSDLERGVPVRPTGADGTPDDFVILGVGDIGASGWGTGNRAATMGVHAPGGTVFTASTTDWPRLVARRHPAVERITRNVLDRLTGPT